MKLLVDMNLSPRWVDLLTRGGVGATHGEKPSVVLLRADDMSPDVIGHQVVIALHQMETELHEGALVTIEPSRTRLRVLPLRTRR